MNVASIGVIVAIIGLIIALLVALYSQMRMTDELFCENGVLRDCIAELVKFQERMVEGSVNRLKFDEKCVYDIQRRVELIEKKLNNNGCKCEDKKLDVYIPRKGE